MSGRTRWVVGLGVALALAAPAILRAQQQTPPQFGGTYSALDARHQGLVQDWVARFNAATGQRLEPGPFYDEVVAFSTKTTFDAVTNALMQSKLTDETGAPLGDALSLVERLDTVRGLVPGTRGDRQFRMYVQLTPTAVDTLGRSKEFKREADNSVYHRGYPQNFREQGGTPSIQISVAADGRRADVDVDYRSSSFPAALFNGHLTASNSDVRAGNNYDRHVNRWSGFQNWWRSFFGIGVEGLPQTPDVTSPLMLQEVPRAGKKNIDVMVNDFLTAWLVEGNAVAAMSYISNQSYGCLADSGGTPAEVDRGIAPYRLLMNLKAAYDAVGPHQSLEGLTTGVRLTLPALKVVQQPHHAQFVIYAVPDDVAVGFDCENRLVGANAHPGVRKYGNYFGAVFYVQAHRDTVVSLLWEQENGYWKIVSWQTGLETREMPAPDAPPEAKVARIPADQSLVDAARAFLESWFILKDYDAAFKYLSERSYACYNLTREPEEPAATSTGEAAQKIRAGMERVGTEVGAARKLDQVIVAVEPFHPAVRLMNHSYSQSFALTSLPNSIADAADCATRERNPKFAGVTASDYGAAFGMNFRFRSQGGEAPVLRVVWLKENGNWRITAYDVELP